MSLLAGYIIFCIFSFLLMMIAEKIHTSVITLGDLVIGLLIAVTPIANVAGCVLAITVIAISIYHNEQFWRRRIL